MRFKLGGLLVLCTLASGCAVSAASAAAPAGPARLARASATTCNEHAGTTRLENGVARIYSRRARVYACLRPSGAPVLLFGLKRLAASRVQLDGRFVAWKQHLGSYPQTERIAVLNLRRRTIRHLGAVQLGGHEAPGSGIAEFLITTGGTLIWQENTGSDLGGASSPFSYTSTLRESSSRGTSILDQSTNSSSFNSARRGFPISSPGLSHSEHVVYWTDDGRIKSAKVQ